MDMSVKLSLAYPAAKLPTQPGEAAQRTEPQVATVIDTPSEPKKDELERAVSDIQDFVQATQRKLDFSIDDSTGRVVVKVIASESGDIIRQIPTEAALKLAQSLSEASSLLFDDRV